MQNKTIPIPHFCQTVGVSCNTLYRYLTPDGNVRKEYWSRTAECRRRAFD